MSKPLFDTGLKYCKLGRLSFSFWFSTEGWHGDEEEKEVETTYFLSISLEKRPNLNILAFIFGPLWVGIGITQ